MSALELGQDGLGRQVWDGLTDNSLDRMENVDELRCLAFQSRKMATEGPMMVEVQCTNTRVIFDLDLNDDEQRIPSRKLTTVYPPRSPTFTRNATWNLQSTPRDPCALSNALAGNVPAWLVLQLVSDRMYQPFYPVQLPPGMSGQSSAAASLTNGSSGSSGW